MTIVIQIKNSMNHITLLSRKIKQEFQNINLIVGTIHLYSISIVECHERAITKH